MSGDEKNKLIRKIIVNSSYRTRVSCFEDRTRDIVIFNEFKIKYIKKPLTGATKRNPQIEMIVDPFAMKSSFYEDEEKLNYCEDFIKLQDAASKLHGHKERIYDATGPSIVVVYEDGRKATYENVEAYECQGYATILEIVDRYMPEIFKNWKK